MSGGKQSVLRELHDLHAVAVWRYVVHLTRDTSSADDIVQETLLRAWRTPHILEQDPSTVRGWLFTVARNLVIDDARSARRRHESAEADPPERVVEDFADELFDTLLVAEALGALSDDHRAVIVRAYYGGRNTAELAAELLAAMPGLLARARAGVEDLGDPGAGEDFAADAGPAADLVDLVTRRREKQRRTFRRRVVLGVSAAVVVLAAAVAVPVLVTRPPAATVALAPVTNSTMTAVADLSAVAWGTSISVECQYPAGEAWGGEDGLWRYALVVTDEAGRATELSTWQAVPGKTVQFDAATAVSLDQIASLEVRKADGQTILAAAVDD